ncbi:MAG: EAL domain-containing protein [Alphaproteobacteria bacterium]
MAHPLLTLSELQTIVKERQGMVCLHPIYAVATHLPIMHEALLRLMDKRGLEVLPRAFIPTALANHLMPQLDLLMLDCLETQLHLHTAKPPTPVSVNISRHSLLDDTYMGRLEASEWKGHLNDLMFELKVGDISRDIAALKSLIGLKSKGTCLCVDYQQGGVRAVELAADLGFDYLKIDAVNISLKYTNAELANVAAACAEAHKAGLKIVFERVETPGDYKAIKLYNPDGVQGYLFGQPSFMFAKTPYKVAV